MLLSKHQEWKDITLDDGQLRNEQLTYDPSAPIVMHFVQILSIMKK
jgi:hypothetical protein